jgi:aspartyl-tRNA(Asn)/glutamyl-tRNA(Gln) amidotransferase subunit A
MQRQTAWQIAAQLDRQETSSRALTEASLAAIERLNPRLGAFITVMADQALAEADAADARRRAGNPLSRLDGVPIGVKDNICTRGEKTTCASRMLAEFRPPYDATVVAKLKAAGMVTVGKTNLDEFAMGSSTEFSAAGPSSNPWDPDRVPGGSSGGSAVAVAAGMVPVSLGSDTGGSIRQPAGFCGIVGMKPTYGRVSRYGLVAFASSLDQIGPFSHDVRDCAETLSIIAGHDPMDSTSNAAPSEDYAAHLDRGSAKGLRVGRPVEFFEAQGIAPEVKAACNATLDKLASEGAEIVDVHMRLAEEFAVATYYVIATAEASSNLARYDGAHYGYRTEGAQNIVEMFSRTRAKAFGEEVKRRILLGTFVLSAETYDAYYLRASRARTLIQREYQEALSKVDVIAAPTSPVPAFKRGEKTGDPVQMYLADIFTLSLNLAGYCGLSLPVGFTQEGLPIGMQLFGGAFQEAKLLQAAWLTEQLLGIAGTRKPAHSA